MLIIILKNVLTIACVYCAYKVSKNFFDDNQRLLRILVTFILTVILFSIMNGILYLVKPNVNVDKQLQSEEMFVALKQKYPQEYQSIVERVSLRAKQNKLNGSEVVALAEQYVAPFTLKLVASASDASRYEFANSFIKTISLLKSKGGTLCYDMMHNQDDIINERTKIVEEVFEQSGMYRAMLTVINDNKVGHAIVSQRDMDKMEQEIFNQLVKKHSKDIALLANPKKAISVDNKQTVCQMMIDLYTLMNDPNSKAKKAVLRRSMQNMASNINNPNLRSNVPEVALAIEGAELPQMASPAF